MVGPTQGTASVHGTRWDALRNTMRRARRADEEVRPDPAAPPYLSYGQEQLFGMCQHFAGASVAYNMPRVYRFQGAVDAQALDSALRDVVTRHESLRTGFRETPEGARRLVTDEVPQLRVEDLRPLPAAEREEAARRITERDVRAEFDLGRPPLVRATLMRLAAEEYVFVLVIHHIVADGWSWDIIHRELAEAYAAFASEAGRSPQWNPARPYAEFVALQRARLSSSVGRESLAYWVDELGDMPPSGGIPMDQDASDEVNFDGERHIFRLGPTLSRRVRQVSADRQVTLAAVMLGSFAQLLRKEYGRSEVVVAAPYANRLSYRMNDTVGYFVNSHVLRISAPPRTDTFGLIAQADSRLGLAFMHQEVPFSAIEAALAGSGDGEHLLTAFQMMFFFHGQRRIQFELPGVTVSRVPYFHTKTTKSDLTLIVHEDDEEVVCHFEYSTDLYSAGAMEKAAASYLRVLEALPVSTMD